MNVATSQPSSAVTVWNPCSFKYCFTPLTIQMTVALINIALSFSVFSPVGPIRSSENKDGFILVENLVSSAADKGYCPLFWQPIIAKVPMSMGWICFCSNGIFFRLLVFRNNGPSEHLQCSLTEEAIIFCSLIFLHYQWDKWMCKCGVMLVATTERLRLFRLIILVLLPMVSSCKQANELW